MPDGHVEGGFSLDDDGDDLTDDDMLAAADEVEDEPEPEPQEAEPAPQPQEAPPEPTVSQLQQELAARNAHVSNLTKGITKYRHEVKEERAAREQTERRFGIVLAKIAEAQGIDPNTLDPDAPPPPPDPERQPIEHLKDHIDKRITESIEPLQKAQYEAAAAKDEKLATDVSTAIQEHHQGQAAAFVEEHPDYPEAEAWLEEKLASNMEQSLRFKHPEATPEQIAAAVHQNMSNAVAQLQFRYAQSNANLSQRVYELARHMGWASGENGAAKPGKLDRLRKNVRSASPIPSGSKSSGRVPKQLSAILADDLSDDEFDAMVEGNDWEKVAEAILGE